MDLVFWLIASPPQYIGWFCMKFYWNVYSLEVQAKKGVTDGSKQVKGYKVEAENSVAHVSQFESNASLFSCITVFFRCMVDSCPYNFCVLQVI
jgi:hypothetical protein